MKNEKQNILIDAISGIDEDLIDQSLKKRFYLKNRKKLAGKVLISSIAAVLCICTVLAATLIPLFGGAPLDPNVPVYEGMTVKIDPPAVKLSAGAITLLSATDTLDDTATPAEPETEAETNADTAPPVNEGLPVFGETYYAMPNEDIYIHIHLTNPAEYEILSFTLNGIKYSSYMFETGSDMQTLILKYNVGNVSGLQEYTIDAIKYVDGENIKDVRMKGDQTVKVWVNGGDGNLNLATQVKFDTVTFEAVWSDGFEGTRELLSLEIYKGDELYRSLPLDATSANLLPLGTRFLLKATYMDGETLKSAVNVFETPCQSQGFLIYGGVISDLGSCTDTVLYFDSPVAASFTQWGVIGSHIKEVYFSGNVKYIEWTAFYGARKLETVYIAEGLTEIDCSFGYMLKNITIPVSVTKIAADSFNAWDSETGHVDIWYGGTLAQWDNIEKGNTRWEATIDSWVYETWIHASDYTVHCSDGTFSKTIEDS